MEIISFSQLIHDPLLSLKKQRRGKIEMVSLFHLIFYSYILILFSKNISSVVANTLKPSETISDGQSMLSQSGTFKLGFFTPSTTSNKRYLGIWYNAIPTQTVVWVANRDSPLPHTSGVVKISSTGNLILVENQTESVIWSSNISKTVESPIVELLESGNLVLRNVDSETYLWQSFDFPGNTLLPGMKIGWNLKTGKSWLLSSWRDSDDPSRGNFTLGMAKAGYNEAVIRRNGSHKYSRSGPWTGFRYSENILTYQVSHNAAELYYTYRTVNKSLLMRLVLVQSTNEGYLEYFSWAENTNSWIGSLKIPRDSCDYYSVCGAYGICDVTTVPICQCLNGFRPKSPQDWSQSEWSKGCEHEVPVNCSKGEGFRKFTSIYKLPDTEFSWVDESINLEECRVKCLSNCSCTAYASSDFNASGSGCIMWLKDLMDMRQMTTGGKDLYIRMGASELDPDANSQTKKGVIIIASFASVAALAVLGLLGWCICKTRKPKGRNENDDLELPLYDLATVKRATNNFSEENKLGKGGFGPVYKGTLEGGQEIAVKRLSKDSTQGNNEFENEVILISKLQHRNLVRLLGYCIHGEEKMLLYEYMQNKSLDLYIFDEKNRRLLDWQKRFQIILGIARGLLYLHHDSIVRIIHRDLKASNVLLDGEMVPKISDFGMARICRGDQVEANTQRVVGTYGYMSPEYAIDGHFSMKSDVFSFGVLVLEIVSGKKNRGFCHPEHEHNLLGHAWILWNDDKSMELVDESVRNSCSVGDVLRCIHVGLLCVQHSSEIRPLMSSVLLLLSSDGTLPVPQPPGFYVGRSRPTSTLTSSYMDENLTVSNDATITLLEAR